MLGNSRPVTSDQSGLNPQLDRTVERHLKSPWQRPVAAHAREAFARAQDWFHVAGAGPLVLDSGCGTGRSSVTLAKQRPDCRVIGIDQSHVRLGRLAGQALPPNLLLLRAECADFWRLAAAARWRPLKHYILYPNPWPKAGHLQRRWHGHPVFPDLLTLGGALEVRSNWSIYLEELARALSLAGYVSEIQPLAGAAEPLSDFERKYQASGHPLFVLTSNLSV